jgi:hypothetical protein
MRAEEDEFNDSLLDEERLRGSSERALRRSRGGEGGGGGGGIFSSMQRGLRKRFCPGPSEEGDRDLRPGHAAHHFTFSEKERMNEYESLDYNVPHSQIYRKYLQQKTKWWYIRKDLSKWLLFCVVGAAVGFVAFLLKQTTELIAEGHFKVTGTYHSLPLSGPSPSLFLGSAVCLTHRPCLPTRQSLSLTPRTTSTRPWSIRWLGWPLWATAS